MPTPLLRKPLLPSHYSVWFDPPDEAGYELLHLVSERRSLTVKGYSFREFRERVIPLLDGRHTSDEILNEMSNLFRADDLTESLNTLTEQGVLVEGEADLPSGSMERLIPQLNLFRDVAQSAGMLQSRLAASTVAVVGLGGAGVGTALGLAAAGVGTLRCIDSLPVSATDVYVSPHLNLQDVGAGRAATLVRRVAETAPEVKTAAIDEPLQDEAQIRAAIAGADFVVSCLDAGQSNFIYKLNRVCFTEAVRWVACSLGGIEVTVGPAVHPGHSACYMCYRMRAIACAADPENAFAFEKYLDRRKRDDGAQRENLVFGAGFAASLIGNEVLKELTGLAEPSLVGRLLTLRLTDLSIERHTVLRKPWCPVCHPKKPDAHGG